MENKEGMTTHTKLPRHPYDRDDEYWENQEGMTTQTQYDFTLEEDDDKTD